MGVRGGRGSYASIHLPNSTAALPMYPTTVNTCVEGTKKECAEATSDSWVYTKTQTSTDMKTFPFFTKRYHCSNDEHVDMLITEEQGGSGWNVQRDYTGGHWLGFFFFKLLLLEF